MEEIIVPTVTFAAIFGIFYIYITARNRERMAIIEKGKDFDLTMFENKKKFDFKGLFIRLGFLSVGVGIGVVIAIFVESAMYSTFHQQIFNQGHYAYTQDKSAPLFVAMIFIFGGLGMILGHLFLRKNEK